MSYQVFALKWRPQNFDEIIGQNHIVTTLKSALQKNRLAHAYIFAGPRGVGKTSTARILAKSLNCKEGPTLNPCGNCPVCIEVSQGRSLDVIEIDGASNRGIDEIRTLRENVKFAPTSGKFKIYIIDEVHMLTTEAFNALLKTLEEPPEFVKFIFATTQPHKVIPTILSRCHRLDFRRIPVIEIISQLERIVRAEKIDIDKEVLFAIAKSSDGSLRDAESILDQLVSFSSGRVSLKDVVSILGLVEQEALFKITDKIIHKDAQGALNLLNQIIDEGKESGIFLANLIEHFRNLMVAKITRADAKLIDLPQEICEKLLEQAGAFSLEELFSAFNILLSAQEMSKRMETLRIPLEISLIKLTQGKKTSSPQPIHPMPKGKQSEHHSQNIPENTASPQQQVTPIAQEKEDDSNPPLQNIANATSLDNVKGVWQNIISGLGRVKMSAATYLNEGSPLKLEGSVLTIAFPRNYSLHKESLERKENREIIEKIVSQMLNTDLRIKFILSQEISERTKSTDNPFVKSALEMFQGRIIKEE